MEVHPPEHGIHSWRDFFVHMATICLGLLIAIGLEQSVEAVHHQHQRHQLKEDLRAEAERNIDVVNSDLHYYAALRASKLDLRKTVNAMSASGGKAGLSYPAVSFTTNRMVMPSDSVWTTAKEDMLVQLLPRPEAGMYSRIEFQHELLMGVTNRWLAMESEVKAFEDNFDDAAAGSVPDLARMSMNDLHEYSRLLSKYVEAIDDVVYRLKLFESLDRAMPDGAHTEAELIEKARHLMEQK
jgi:hypothetical protein